jgi:hypothetical protein
MRALALPLAVAPLLVAAGAAHGDAQKATPSPAQGRGETLPVVPTLSLSASTDEDAKINVSIDILTQRGFPANWKLDIAPQASVASSKGIANLFSVDKKASGAKTWSGGVSFSFIGWTQNPYNTYDSEHTRLARAYNACIDHCRDVSDKDDDSTTFCKDKPKLNSDFDASLLCQLGQDRMHDAYDVAYPVFGAHPTWVLSSGYAINGGTFDYYLADSANNLSEKNDTHIGGTVAASLTWVHQFLKRDAVSFEAAAYYDAKWNAADGTVHFCSPAGQVPHMTGGGSDPAQSCTDATLGAPSQTHRLFVAAEVGYVDIHTDPKDHNKPKSVWRVAGGPVFRYTSGDPTLEIGGQVPVYFDASSAAGYKGDYKGIIRLSPTIVAVHDADGWRPRFSLTVDILTDRFLFPRSLAWKQ